MIKDELIEIIEVPQIFIREDIHSELAQRFPDNKFYVTSKSVYLIYNGETYPEISFIKGYATCLFENRVNKLLGEIR